VSSTDNLSTPANNSTVLGLSFVAGLGLILMILALSIGMIQGSAADGSTIGLLFITGLALLIVGGVGWFAVVQPQKHFDDINQPQDDGHHGHSEPATDDSHAAETPAAAGHH
jgi:hypothetical protein